MLRNGRLMRINRFGFLLHHPAEPPQGGRPAGHLADHLKRTPVRARFAGVCRRIRQSAGTSRAFAARILACTAVLTLAGCMTTASRVDAPDAIVIAATATANEPAPALSLANVALLETTGESSASGVAFLVNPADDQPLQLPLTPLRSDGQVEYGPRRPQLLAQNISRIESQIVNEAATGPFDLLNTMLNASRVTSPPATMLLLTSGVTTSGGFDLRKVGWAEPPAAAAAALKQRGLVPDLAGWIVIFSGLGETTGRQPALPLPQQTTLASYWLAICHTAGAVSCHVDDSPRPVRSSRSKVLVPVVPVPAVQSITGPHGQQQSVIPADLLFAFNSATLLPGADSYLDPIVTQAATESYSVSVTGQASPDGGTASYNLRLSTLRAQAVEHRLIMLGLAPRKVVQVNGIGTAGQSCTVNGTLDESKCAQLRRVVITLSLTTAAS